MTLTVQNVRNWRDRYTVRVWPANPRFRVGHRMRGPGGVIYLILEVAA